MPSFNIAHAVAALIPLILSLSVHEYAHAWSAQKLGDDTASRAGRLTLNPLSHIDPFGTLVLPLILLISGTGFMFGWAKPVPVNPARFRRGVHMGRGMAWTAGAGPLSNLLLSLLAAVTFGLLGRYAPATLASGGGVRELLENVLVVNLALALFNLIPVPPLDGSRIVDGYMPLRFRAGWERVTALAPFLLLAVFIFGGRLIAGPFSYLFGLLANLVNFISAA
ncbi:peptidase M50 [Anaeromyxobacter dehalogenans 2CP-C]|uniref:Peptidase M50 n=1 Tax=Anaeromyxobacter dehalogenans (strain 2CP-C) TaxID=290397 RepID=Q2III0_ANADE|nr:peptidase M50 [Anaeromyxobacter dehalogenans 2CP-C]